MNAHMVYPLRYLYAVVFIVTILLDLSCLVVTLLNPDLGDLTGKINRIDHEDIWSRMDIFSHIVYWVGDLTCHQQPSRSLIIDGGQFPVCIRDTGLVIGTSIGAAIALFSNIKVSKRLFIMTLILSFLTIADWIFKSVSGIDIIQLAAVTAVISGTSTVLFGYCFFTYVQKYLIKRFSGESVVRFFD